MNPSGFQTWVDAWGNLYCADGVVIQPTTAARIHVGAGAGFGDNLTGQNGEILRAFPAAYGATALGGSGRNLTTTGLTRDLSGPEVPCGLFSASEANTWRLGIFVLVKTGSSAATISDGANTVAILSTGGTAPVGNYAATAYGKTTYHGGADFTIAAAAETGTPLGVPGAVSAVTSGTGPTGAWTADSASAWHLTADSAWTLLIASDGSAQIKHSGTVMATRAAGSAWNPAGVYEANSAGQSGYNSGYPFNIVLTITPLNPRAGYVYLQVVCSSGILSAVNGPFFGSLPSNSGETYYVPLAQSDGAGGLEQFHTGALIWGPVAGGSYVGLGGGQAIVNSTAGNVGLTVKGAASQTAALMDFQSSAGASLLTLGEASQRGYFKRLSGEFGSGLYAFFRFRYDTTDVLETFMDSGWNVVFNHQRVGGGGMIFQTQGTTRFQTTSTGLYFNVPTGFSHVQPLEFYDACRFMFDGAGAAASMVMGHNGTGTVRFKSCENNNQANLTAFEFQGTLATFTMDSIRISTAKTPASSGAAGTAGMICWDASYFYVCVAANTWRRAAHATW